MGWGGGVEEKKKENDSKNGNEDSNVSTIMSKREGNFIGNRVKQTANCTPEASEVQK